MNLRSWLFSTAVVLLLGVSAATLRAQETRLFTVTQDSAVAAEELARLEKTVAAALDVLQRSVAPLKRPVKLHIGSGGLKTGYSPERDEVVFCSSKDVVDAGLKSVDVIHHELFHAFASQYHPLSGAMPMDEETEVLHEALADYFAHEMVPDAHFGEGFYVSRPWIREYRTTLCYALARGAHARGNALCTHLLDCGYTLGDLGLFLTSRPFERAALLGLRGTQDACLDPVKHPELTVEAGNYALSSLGKYAISPGRPLLLTFNVNELFRRELDGLGIAWDAAELSAAFQAEQVSASPEAVCWRVTARAGQGMTKAVARVLSGKTVVGFVPFYFRVAAVH